MNAPPSISIVGAGLAGSLLGILLAREGYQVDIYERRPDSRKVGYEEGRSINLALAERGLNALRAAGLEQPVMAQAIMMRGRMVHAGGEAQLQRYGRDDSEVIWSVHRGRLNLLMLDAAEAAGARLHFDCSLADVDWQRRQLRLTGGGSGPREAGFDLLIGADGAGSAVRAAMQKQMDLGLSIEPLGHGYKELEIPPAADGGFRIERNALHIWPRGRYMCIALPNTEGTFTVTLFLPAHGPHPSFDSVHDGASALRFFGEDFPDTLALIPDLARDFESNPVGQLATLRLQHWHHDGLAVLIGDAAHAMVPFHGQGMNCAFEDCVALVEHLRRQVDRGAAFAAFEAERKPNAEAIQAMALENYLEMRDRVDDDDYLLQRALERLLAERHPGHFVPRYSMVSFMRIPYATAFERGRLQRELLVEATRGRRSLDDIDLAALDARIRDTLPPLDAG